VHNLGYPDEITKLKFRSYLTNRKNKNIHLSQSGDNFTLSFSQENLLSRHSFYGHILFYKKIALISSEFKLLTSIGISPNFLVPGIEAVALVE